MKYVGVDKFFRNNYRILVRSCTYDFNPADVEETVSDMILKHYSEFESLIVDDHEDQRVLRSWIRKRIMWALRTKIKYAVKFVHVEGLDDLQSTLDNPADILDIKQRMPPVRAILIDYETQYEKDKPKTNTQSQRSYFNQEKKKLYAALGIERKTAHKGQTNFKKVTT